MGCASPCSCAPLLKVRLYISSKFTLPRSLSLPMAPPPPPPNPPLLPEEVDVQRNESLVGYLTLTKERPEAMLLPSLLPPLVPRITSGFNNTTHEEEAEEGEDHGGVALVWSTPNPCIPGQLHRSARNRVGAPHFPCTTRWSKERSTSNHAARSSRRMNREALG